MSATRPTLSIAERKAILDAEVTKYVKRGFRVQSRTDTEAQLVKPKKFSFLWAFLWLLLFGVGLIVYLLYYWSKKDEQVYLQVDEYGKVRRTKR
jgi:hypothetical protein